LSPPVISDLNWSQGETIANMVVVKIGANYSINVYNAIGSADLIIDVIRYYSRLSSVFNNSSESTNMKVNN
jgi:hypothetical protein